MSASLCPCVPLLTDTQCAMTDIRCAADMQRVRTATSKRHLSDYYTSSISFCRGQVNSLLYAFTYQFSEWSPFRATSVLLWWGLVSKRAILISFGSSCALADTLPFCHVSCILLTSVITSRLVLMRRRIIFCSWTSSRCITTFTSQLLLKFVSQTVRLPHQKNDSKTMNYSRKQQLFLHVYYIYKKSLKYYHLHDWNQIYFSCVSKQSPLGGWANAAEYLTVVNNPDERKWLWLWLRLWWRQVYWRSLVYRSIHVQGGPAKVKPLTFCW